MNYPESNNTYFQNTVPFDMIIAIILLIIVTPFAIIDNFILNK